MSRWLWSHGLHRLPHWLKDLLRVCPFSSIHNRDWARWNAKYTSVKIVNGYRWLDFDVERALKDS